MASKKDSAKAPKTAEKRVTAKKKVASKPGAQEVVSKKKQAVKKTAVHKKSAPKVAKPKKSTKSDKQLFWMGVGASAGGLEALSEFVSNIPGSATRNKNMTYIVAQNLSPNGMPNASIETRCVDLVLKPCDMILR